MTWVIGEGGWRGATRLRGGRAATEGWPHCAAAARSQFSVIGAVFHRQIRSLSTADLRRDADADADAEP